MKEENIQLKNALIELAFSDKEARVYLALLSLGKGTVSQISRKATINRTTGYDILGTLVERGLAQISGKEPKQECVAESPEELFKFLQDKKEELDNSFTKAKKLVPELKSVHNLGDRPRVFFYEGKEGLERVYEDTLTSHETIRAYANVDEMHKGLPRYFPRYYKRRAGKGIHIRAILPDNEMGKLRREEDKNEERTSALVPADKYYFIPEINVYDNKVMIASWREKLGIIIESQEIADTMKKIFELAWAEARRFSDK